MSCRILKLAEVFAIISPLTFSLLPSRVPGACPRSHSELVTKSGRAPRPRTSWGWCEICYHVFTVARAFLCLEPVLPLFLKKVTQGGTRGHGGCLL